MVYVAPTELIQCQCRWSYKYGVPTGLVGDRAENTSVLKSFTRTWERPEPPPQREEMGFFTDSTLCIGCKACEVACKQWNMLPADGNEWSGKSYDNTLHLGATTWRHVTFTEQVPATRVAARAGRDVSRGDV